MNKIGSLIFALIFTISTLANVKDSLLSISKYTQLVSDIKSEKNFDKSIILCNKIMLLSDTHLNITLKGKAEIQKLKIYNKFHKYAQGLELAIILEDKASRTNKYLDCENTYYLERYLYDYMIAINNYKQAIKHLEHITDQPCNEDGIYNVVPYEIAIAYINNDQPQKAISLFEDRIKKLNSINEKTILIGAHNQFGLIFTTLKKNDEAIFHFEKAIDYINTTNERAQLKPTIQGNIGQILFNKRDYKKALEYFIKDSEGSLANNEINSYANAQLSMAILEHQEKNNRVANNRLKNLLSYEDEISSNSLLAIFKILSSINNETNNPSNAFNYLTKYSQLNDSLNILKNKKYEVLINEYNQSNYSRSVDQLKKESLLAKKELNTIIKEKKKDNFRNQLMIFSLIITLGLVVLWVKKIKDNKKKNDIIIQNKLLLSKQNLALKTSQQEVLELKVKADNKKINTLALELNVKKDFTEKLINRLEKIEKIEKSDLRSIEFFIQNELDLKSSRAKLQNNIDSLGNVFFDTLLKKHPNLNDADLNLCALIVFNLPNKEIAISKNIATNSVKISKNRLKKKLRLSTNEVLKDYLNSFL